jgi:two-component system nitrate/nitrite response regulator NarL
VPRGRGLTRITLVEDHVLFAEALDVALTLEGHEVHRVSPTDHGLPSGHLFEAIVRTRPSVVLLDLHLGASANGARLVQPLTLADIAVVVVTGSIDRARWGECLFHGARTVLPKSTPLNTILATIRMIGEGRRVLPREERDRLLAYYHEEKAQVRESRARLESLTTREREILDHLTNGQQVREIARESFVSEATVRTQVKSILGKMGVSSQLAAVGVALRAHRRQPLQPYQREQH